MSEQVSSQASWHKLSPMAVIFFVVRFWYKLGNNVFAIVPAVVVFRDYIADNPFLVVAGIFAALTLSVLWSWISFLMVSYRLDNEGVDLRSGVFNKQLLQLPFSKVQNIRIEHPWYFRLSGHCQLVLESAGSADQEVMLVALRAEYAEQIKAQILALRSANLGRSKASDTQAKSTQDSSPEDPGILLNKRSVKDLIMYGLSSNRGWLIVGAAAPFFGVIAEGFTTRLAALGVNPDLLTYGNVPVWQFLVALFTLFALSMALLTLLSIAIAVMTYFDYSLHRFKDRYAATMGLLSRKEIAIPLSRIQKLTLQQDWLDLLLRRTQLRFAQVSDGIQAKDLLVPALKADEVTDLMADLYPQLANKTFAFSRVSRVLLWVYLGCFWLPIAILTIGLSSWLVDWQAATLLFVPLLLLAGLYINRWRRWGYAMDNEFIYVRSGLLGKKIVVMPLAKVQQHNIVQTPFQRRHQLKSLYWISAAGVLILPFIGAKQADDMANFSLYQLESQALDWM